MKTTITVKKETRNGLMKIKYERDLIDMDEVIQYLIKKGGQLNEIKSN